MRRHGAVRLVAAIAGAVALCGAFGAAHAQPAESVFTVEPYVQMGDAPRTARRESLVVMWHAGDVDASWAVEWRQSAGAAWVRSAPPAFRRVAVSNVPAHRVYSARLQGLRPGVDVAYRMSRNGFGVFEATARVRKGPGVPYRVAVFGDVADGSIYARQIAFRAFEERPDIAVVPGDIVYGAGLITQYRTKWFPVLNAPEASTEGGAPLLRSTVVMGNLGNHDVGGRSLTKTPDGLAYYMYFSQPLNGPDLAVGAPNTTPLEGPDAAKRAFLDAAGPNYPRLANYSFDYGNSHWTVIDGNTYVSWDDPALRLWLENDLKRAAGATWRFVAFHQPGFSSSVDHYSEQHMRRLAPLFERYGVDVVWAGHVHNYQRSLPLRFKPDLPGKPTGPQPGEFVLDRTFDGSRATRANGVIYIVTGGGGAGLYDPEQDGNPPSWQPFTATFVSKIHSLSVADIDGRRMVVRQVASDGREVDRFIVTK